MGRFTIQQTMRVIIAFDDRTYFLVAGGLVWIGLVVLVRAWIKR